MQMAASVSKAMAVKAPTSKTFCFGFAPHFKMIFDMIKGGSGLLQHNLHLLSAGKDLHTVEDLTTEINVASLPKAIGGDAVSLDEDGEEDETCCLGIEHPTWSAFVKGLRMDELPLTSVNQSEED